MALMLFLIQEKHIYSFKVMKFEKEKHLDDIHCSSEKGNQHFAQQPMFNYVS